MKALSALIFMFIFVIGATLGYILHSLDTPPKATMSLLLFREDGVALSLPLYKENFSFFQEKKSVTNITIIPTQLISK